MQISKKADYALRAMAILAALPPDRTMQAQELADSGKIPIKFFVYTSHVAYCAKK